MQVLLPAQVSHIPHLRYLCWYFNNCKKCYVLKKFILFAYFHSYCDVEIIDDQLDQHALNQMCILILQDLAQINENFAAFADVKIK